MVSVVTLYAQTGLPNAEYKFTVLTVLTRLGGNGADPQGVVPVGVDPLEIVDGIGHGKTVQLQGQFARIGASGGLQGRLGFSLRILDTGDHHRVLKGYPRIRGRRFQGLQFRRHGIQQLSLLHELLFQLVNALGICGCMEQWRNHQGQKDGQHGATNYRCHCSLPSKNLCVHHRRMIPRAESPRTINLRANGTGRQLR